VAVRTKVLLLLSQLDMALLKDQDENSAAMKLIKIIKVIEWINKWANEIVDSDGAVYINLYLLLLWRLVDGLQFCKYWCGVSLMYTH
jgi:hypothetical protein